LVITVYDGPSRSRFLLLTLSTFPIYIERAKKVIAELRNYQFLSKRVPDLARLGLFVVFLCRRNESAIYRCLGRPLLKYVLDDPSGACATKVSH
jgi:hypothetical protein